MNESLIIFYRNPELGKVKTRLARSVGDAAALALYYKLAAHARAITEHLPQRKIVYYSSFVDREDSWENHLYEKAVQSGESLGERMSNAFAGRFGSGDHAVVIIGTDCYELTSEIIRQAFDELVTNDVVIGPATDGGYYLLGTTRFYTGLFQNKAWSTETVLHDTIGDCVRMGLRFTQLPPLSDVDTEADLPPALRIHGK